MQGDKGLFAFRDTAMQGKDVLIQEDKEKKRDP